MRTEYAQIKTDNIGRIKPDGGHRDFVRSTGWRFLTNYTQLTAPYKMKIIRDGLALIKIYSAVRSFPFYNRDPHFQLKLPLLSKL